VGDDVDPEVINRLAGALAKGTLCHDFHVPPAKADDSGYRSRLRGLVKSHEAITGAGFPEILKRAVGLALETGRTRLEIAQECGITLMELVAWMDTGGMESIEPAQAQALDRVLHAQGAVLESYVAWSQIPFGCPSCSAKDLILGRRGFAMLLRAGRSASGRTLASVAGEISKPGMRVSSSVLGSWELGHAVASEQFRAAIDALDTLYALNGELLGAWAAEGPRRILPTYAMRFAEWPDRLKAQFVLLTEYKTSNPHKWRCNEGRTGDRWTSADTINSNRQALERFFGYLREQQMATEHFSLSLLADWDLAEGYFHFVRERVGRNTFSSDVITSTKTWINLVGYFLPHLEDEVSREPYWSGRLPTARVVPHEKVVGVFKDVTESLGTLAEQWAEQRGQMHRRALSLLRQHHRFARQSLAGRAAPLVDHPDAFAELENYLVEQIDALPLRIRSASAAVHCRKVLACALVLARAFRPANYRQLGLHQCRMGPDGQASLAIPESEFKTRGRGGSRGGFFGDLSPKDYVPALLQRYLREARPILLGRPGPPDAGYVLTPLNAGKDPRWQPGRRLGAEVLRGDVQEILGCHPYAGRFLVATQGALKGIPLAEIANLLMHRVEMTEQVYGALSPSARNWRANQLLDAMTQPSRAA
jgi:hypothetical protein